jgi:hypothetical protein
VSPVRCELGFYTHGDGIYSHFLENLKSYMRTFHIMANTFFICPSICLLKSYTLQNSTANARLKFFDFLSESRLSGKKREGVIARDLIT